MKNRRLHVSDVESGNQPFTDPNGKYIMISCFTFSLPSYSFNIFKNETSNVVLCPTGKVFVVISPSMTVSFVFRCAGLLLLYSQV